MHLQSREFVESFLIHIFLDPHLRMGPETTLSDVPIENTSDMWLSPFSNSIVGQWSGPTLQSSSCKALLKALSAPLIPGSSSAVASMIFTVDVFSAGRLDRAS